MDYYVIQKWSIKKMSQKKYCPILTGDSAAAAKVSFKACQIQ